MNNFTKKLYKIQKFLCFHNKYVFSRRYNRFIKRKQEQYTFENQKQEEKKMREISKEEMREVTAGRWKCHTCKKTYFLWIQLWSWASHGCVGFKYHWVF